MGPALTPDDEAAALACPLFSGMARDELARALLLLGARARRYAKDEVVQRAGEPFLHVGVVLAGEVDGSFDT